MKILEGTNREIKLTTREVVPRQMELGTQLRKDRLEGVNIHIQKSAIHKGLDHPSAGTAAEVAKDKEREGYVGGTRTGALPRVAD